MLKFHSTHYFYCITKQQYIRPCSQRLPETNFVKLHLEKASMFGRVKTNDNNVSNHKLTVTYLLLSR